MFEPSLFSLRSVPSVAPAWRSSTLVLVMLTGGCAGHHLPDLDWLPADAPTWDVRDVDEQEPPSWVAFYRDVDGTHIKDIGISGLVDASPSVTMQALRHRLLDEAYVPDGLELDILFESDEEVVTYGLAAMPWPFLDREVTERMVFSYDAETGAYRVEVDEVDTDDAVPRGVRRVERVHNIFIVAPTDGGASVLTASSLHDMGGTFPNAMIYTPVRNGLVTMLHEIRDLTPLFEGAGEPAAGLE